MKGWRFTPLDEQPTPTDAAQALTVRVSPLALSQGVAAKGQMQECSVCKLQDECMRRVKALKTFADPNCEKAIDNLRNYLPGRPSAYAVLIMEVLSKHGALSIPDIARTTGIEVKRIKVQLYRMLDYGSIEFAGIRPGKAKPPAKLYRLKEQV